MKKVPSLNYEQVIKALHRDGWVVIRQKGSHIRLHKHTNTELLKLTIPVHRPIKRSTLAAIRIISMFVLCVGGRNTMKSKKAIWEVEL